MRPTTSSSTVPFTSTTNHDANGCQGTPRASKGRDMRAKVRLRSSTSVLLLGASLLFACSQRPDHRVVQNNGTSGAPSFSGSGPDNGGGNGPANPGGGAANPGGGAANPGGGAANPGGGTNP